jgi:hypothetical protein
LTPTPGGERTFTPTPGGEMQICTVSLSKNERLKTTNVDRVPLNIEEFVKMRKIMKCGPPRNKLDWK